MSEMTTFTSDKESLQDILKAIKAGKVQLPEFQRGWVWDDIHIISLLASVSLSYPIGAVMMLENGNPDVRFKPRPVEGVDLSGEIEPERFILDGQQRLTSLFQTLSMNAPVKTRDVRKRDITRWYYIAMREALSSNGDREDAIKSIPEDRISRNFRNEVLSDFSTPAAEFEHCLFPVNQLFDPSAWRREFNKFWQHDEAKSNLFDEFERAIIERYKQYQIPVIKLLKQTPKIAVCQVFEKVNTGGVPLTVFELMTASFAADGFNLREDWEGKHNERGRKLGPGRKDRLHEKKVLRSVGADELLQCIALLVTYGRKQRNADAPVSCKRADILKLGLDEYQANVESASSGFEQAGKFLFQQKIFSNRDLPYTTQLVPLAAALAILGDRADTDAARSKLVRWYWCGVFGELYGGAIETRFARDVVEIVDWVRGGNEPSSVVDCNVAPNRLDTLRTRNSAAYKGLYALLMRDGCLDFRTGIPIEVQTYFSDAIDIHHVFPRAWCKRNKIEARLYDSIINKTALSDRTNRMIGGNAPASYLQAIREKSGMDEQRQKEVLDSHVIDVMAMNSNDFEKFYAARREGLLARIERATGKPIARNSGSSADEEPVDDNEEENGEAAA